MSDQAPSNFYNIDLSNIANATQNFGDFVRSEHKTWMLLDCAPSRNSFSFTLQQIAKALNAQKIEPVFVNLAKDGVPLDPKALRNILKRDNPDYILWDGCGAYRHWDVIKESKSKKINTIFDDPVMRSEGFGVVKQMIDAHNHGVNFFCWDPYWADVMMLDWGIIAHPIELAALPDEYYPSTIRLSDDVVFIGHLHSPRDIDHKITIMNRMFQKVAKDIQNQLPKFKYGSIKSWDLLIEDMVDSYSAGDKQLFHDTSYTQPNDLYTLRNLVWMMSKNENRIRILKRALKVHDVSMFCEMSILDHCSEHEVRSLLGEWGPRLTMFSTTGAHMKHLGQCYHYGKIHIQATDPQSVYAGIPYRVYQTAGAGRPLLTDYKRDWNKSFTYGTDFETYESEDEFENKLSLLLKEEDKLKYLGDNIRLRFDTQHTWKHRLSSITDSTLL